MKLYNVPRNSTIVLKEGIVLKIHHIEGMYSVCTDEDGNVYHIGATEEVTVKEPKSD
jgi:antirestriction protein